VNYQEQVFFQETVFYPFPVFIESSSSLPLPLCVLEKDLKDFAGLSLPLPIY